MSRRENNRRTSDGAAARSQASRRTPRYLRGQSAFTQEQAELVADSLPEEVVEAIVDELAEAVVQTLLRQCSDAPSGESDTATEDTAE